MASRALRWVLAGSSLGMVGALPACSLLLDFDEPLESIDAGTVDSSAVDAAVVPDATPSLDAATAANCGALEPNDSFEEPQMIAPMTIAAAHCPGGDLDFYAFDLAANSDLTITLDFLDDPTPGDLNLRLFDSSQVLRSIANGMGTTDQIQHSQALGTGLPAGRYVIEVFPAIGSASFAKDYSLTLQQAPSL